MPEQRDKAHSEAVVLRTKPKWLHLTPGVAALGMEAFQRDPPMNAKIHKYILKELNLSEEESEKSTDFVDRMIRITLEMFWTKDGTRKKRLCENA